MNFNNLSISQRLNLAFAVAWTFMVALVGVSYTQLEGTLSSQASSQEVARRIALTSEWQQLTNLNLSRSVAVLMAQDALELRKQYTPQIKDTTERINNIQKELEGLMTASSEKTLLSDISDRRKTYLTQREEALKLVDASAANEAVKNKLMPAAQAYMGAMETLAKSQKEAGEKMAAATVSSIRAAEWLMLGLAVVGIGFGAVLIWSVARSVKGPLQLAVKTTQAIASGDLSTPVETDGSGEIGQLLRGLATMQQSLRQLVGSIRSSTDNISTASVEIATGNQDLGQRTEQTASNLQQATSSMEHLTSNVKQSADSARQANQLASNAAEVAARGGQVVSQVVSTMDEINASSKKISDIIGVIDGIAFQTNILALNAAVEAARAGEQGRGFAVVASEVRSLAGRSAEAAKEIKTLIGASVERVETGSRLVEDAGSTMKEIVTSVQRVSDIISEITAASTEQSDGITQVSNSVLQLDQMTQQNAALVEQGAASAESLRDQATKLAEVVGTFKLGSELGAQSTSMAPRPAAKQSARAPAPRPTQASEKAQRPAKASPPASHAPAPAAHASPSASPSKAASTPAGDEWESF